MPRVRFFLRRSSTTDDSLNQKATSTFGKILTKRSKVSSGLRRNLSYRCPVHSATVHLVTCEFSVGIISVEDRLFYDDHDDDVRRFRRWLLMGHWTPGARQRPATLNPRDSLRMAVQCVLRRVDQYYHGLNKRSTAKTLRLKTLFNHLASNAGGVCLW
jgi:hypothetical protein